jgi:hypothetical protein
VDGLDVGVAAALGECGERILPTVMRAVGKGFGGEVIR